MHDHCLIQELEGSQQPGQSNVLMYLAEDDTMTRWAHNHL